MRIPWSKPDIGREEIAAANRVLESGWVSVGEETNLFERELASYIGCRDVVVFNSGTSALVGALLAHGSDDWVRVKHLPSYTFPATMNALLAAGGGQYGQWFVDDVDYMPVNPKTVHALPPKPTWKNAHDIYVPVSYAGLPLDRDEWGKLGVTVVEDAAESFGAKANGFKVGAQGWDATFSFHTAKLITMVEGGAVATDDPLRGEKLRCIRANGESRTEKGAFVTRGLNMKPSDIHSAIGREQLRKVDKYLDRRERVSRIYREYLQGLVEFQYVPDHVERHGNMMFPVFVDDPFKLSVKLRERGIDTRLGWKPLSGDQWARHVYERVICLPIYNTMLDSDAEYVASKVMEAMI